MRLAEWIAFNVGLPLISVALSLLVPWLINRTRGLTAILRDGQLFLFAATLIASAMYDVFRQGASWRDAGQGLSSWAGLLVVLCLAMFVLCAAVYGVALAQIDATDDIYRRRMAAASICAALFAVLLVIGLRYTLGLVP
jgi:p-aminobenzoyl-glutamate transporter AbgT